MIMVLYLWFMATDSAFLTNTDWTIPILYPRMNFPAMHRHFPGGFDAKLHLVTVNAQHCNHNVVLDADTFHQPPAQN
jgi:hypothetical protein